MYFFNFYYTVLLINIMYRQAILPGNSGFPTLQIDNTGVFYLLDALLLLLKENMIFPAFCGKYERKCWHVFIFVVKYFSWTVYCKIFFVSIFALLFFFCFLFFVVFFALRFFTGSPEKTCKYFSAQIL